MNKMNNFLLYCAAVNPHLLERCPSQKTKYACIGGAVLATALLACGSGGFAFYTIYGNALTAALFGLIWAVIIFNLDRLFLSSIRLHAHVWQELLIALPRLALAALISIVISKPLELSIFRSEIDAEMTAARNAAYMDAKRKQDRDPAFSDEAKKLENDNMALRQRITAAETSKNAAYNAYIAEAEGRAGTHLVGRGPVFEDKKNEAQKVESAYKEEKGQAEKQIGKNEARLAELQTTKARKLAEVDASQKTATGLMARIRALHALCDRDSAIAGTSLVVTLLLLTLEICPLALKLLGAFNKRRPYEQLLDAHEAAEEAEAQIAIHEAESRITTEKALIQHLDAVRLDEQRKANGNIMRAVVDGQHALAQDAVRAWNDQQRDLLQKDPDLFFQVQ